MAIHKFMSSTSIRKVKDVYQKEETLNKIQRVWVHNGTKFVLVKGRVYEVVWEKDLSEWGGTSWDNSDFNMQPHNNEIEDMYILDNGNLLAVMSEYLRNGTNNPTNEGRYALAEINADTGDISKWGGVKNWTVVSNAYYIKYYTPIRLVKLKDYFVFYTEMCHFSMFNTDGVLISSNVSPDYETDFGNRSTADKTAYSSRIYIGATQAKDKKALCLYLEYSGSAFGGFWGMNENCYYIEDFFYPETQPLYLQNTGNLIICYNDFYDYNRCHLIIHSGNSRIASLQVDGAIEIPLYSKDGYVYLHRKPKSNNDDYFTVVKRKISDLSLVWTSSIEKLSNIPTTYGGSRGCKQCCEPYNDEAFITDLGIVIYEDGRWELPKNYSNAETYAGAFKQGFGYVMQYSSTDKICSLLKLREVAK